MMNRRKLLRNMALSTGALALGNAVKATEKALPTAEIAYKHSACRWCYRDIPMEEFCERALDIGLHSIELLLPEEWPLLEKHGLDCAVGTADFINISDAFTNRGNHRFLQASYLPLLRKAADAGVPNVICYSGNKNGLKSEKALEFCARGLEPIVKEAENLGITLVMEMLNSKIDHPDYMADSTAWGVALVNKIGSTNFRLLYDIYQMQIMEGNVINTIQQYSSYFKHYQTGGVPGRREINSSQELNYPAIIRAIAESGYTGYIGQEFIPSYENKMSALEEALWICTLLE